MNIYKQFRTDAKAEIEGVWVTLSPTASVKIARSGNPRHSEVLKRISAPYLKPGMRTSDLSDETWTDITLQAAAEALLVDWRGVLGEDDAPLAYSPAEALRALRMKDFAEFVFRVSSGMEHYRAARLAELEKN